MKRDTQVLETLLNAMVESPKPRVDVDVIIGQIISSEAEREIYDYHYLLLQDDGFVERGNHPQKLIVRVTSKGQTRYSKLQAGDAWPL